jgi:hypothetical protein
MTKKEQRAVYSHAKQHVIEAIEDALMDEHHSVMRVDGVERRDMQLLAERYMVEFLRQIQRTKFYPLDGQ